MPAGPQPLTHDRIRLDRSDGVVGKLTSEQERKLKEFWTEFFKLIDESPTEGSGAKSAAMQEANDKPGKDIPKDDAAKERMKAEQEMRDAKLAFIECESRSRRNRNAQTGETDGLSRRRRQTGVFASWMRTGASCVPSLLPGPQHHRADACTYHRSRWMTPTASCSASSAPASGRPAPV